MIHLKSSHPLKSGLMLCILWAGLAAGAHAENCQIQLSDTTVDYGSLTRAGIIGKSAAGPNVSLGDRQMTLNVMCQKATKIHLIVRGSTGQENFKFGDSGQFKMLLSDALLDGQQANLQSVQISDKQSLEPGATLAVTPGTELVPSIAGQQVTGKNLSLQVRINAEVTDIATKVRGQTTWEGSADFQVVEH